MLNIILEEYSWILVLTDDSKQCQIGNVEWLGKWYAKLKSNPEVFNGWVYSYLQRKWYYMPSAAMDLRDT